MCYVKSGFMSVQIMSLQRQHRFFLQQHKRVYIEMKGTGNVQCNFNHQNQSSVSFYKVEKLAIFKALFICLVCMQFLTITNLMRLFSVTCAKRPACHMFFFLNQLIQWKLSLINVFTVLSSDKMETQKIWNSDS